MAGPTIDDAFANCPSSSDKTALITAFKAVGTAITNAQTNGKFSAAVSAQLADENANFAQRVSRNLQS